ncbi:MAG: FGGY-family carbohydrate kinase, partial [Campylobacterota bacterium]|nr:FGGY-family carbohydrate kinase [Campylobacterota bacterium]
IMRWFRDAFCDLEKIEAKKQGVDVYTYLENIASKVPVGSHGIMPIFSDAMKYGKWYHAAPSFINLSIDATTCNKASMFRSLQENAAIVSDINLRNISKFSGVHVEEIVFAGGGSKGHLWSQILCDVVGVPLKIPHVKEATALGCAMAAGVGAGVYESIESAAASLVKWDKHYEPNTQNHAKYRDIESTWQQVYNEQLKLVDNNLTTSMWKAPGV